MLCLFQVYRKVIQVYRKVIQVIQVYRKVIQLSICERLIDISKNCSHLCRMYINLAFWSPYLKRLSYLHSIHIFSEVMVLKGLVFFAGTNYSTVPKAMDICLYPNIHRPVSNKTQVCIPPHTQAYIWPHVNLYENIFIQNH